MDKKDLPIGYTSTNDEVPDDPFGARFINDDPIAYPNGYYYIFNDNSMFDLSYDPKKSEFS